MGADGQVKAAPDCRGEAEFVLKAAPKKQIGASVKRVADIAVDAGKMERFVFGGRLVAVGHPDLRQSAKSPQIVLRQRADQYRRTGISHRPKGNVHSGRPRECGRLTGQQSLAAKHHQCDVQRGKQIIRQPVFCAQECCQSPFRRLAGQDRMDKPEGQPRNSINQMIERCHRGAP